MATYTNQTLTINNFMEPFYYKIGKGKVTKTESMENFYDNKLSFLNNTFTSTRYVVKQKVFLPNLSVKFYGTSSLWWVIARFNGIIFPLSEMKIGTTLYIPVLSQISKEINKNQVTSQNSVGQTVVL